MTTTSDCCEQVGGIARVLQDMLGTSGVLSTATVADGLFSIAAAIRAHSEATKPRHCPACGATIEAR